jgi:hypothetical protein
MSETPRTDEQEHFIDGDRGIVDSGLARELERELNSANSIIRQQQLLDEENLGLKQRIKRLEDIIKRAGCKFFEDGTDGRIAVNMLTILDEAREAKP